MTHLTQTSKNQSGFYIGVGCPGCGGELALESEFFVISCDHCGSVLRVTLPEIPPAYMVAAKVSKREARFGIDEPVVECAAVNFCSPLALAYGAQVLDPLPDERVAWALIPTIRLRRRLVFAHLRTIGAARKARKGVLRESP